MSELGTLKYEISERKDTPGAYGVEAIGPEGEVYMAVFSGPMARERANEYARSISGKEQSLAA
jgi:hypothetical protein